MTAIAIEGVTKRFGVRPALDAVGLAVPSGSFTALLGPSGCGKTTLLRMIAGFEAPDEGHIAFDGEIVCDPRRQVPPEARGVGIVFQSYALWPHMSVAENVAYPLRARRVAGGEVAGRVAAVLALVGLSGFEARRIDELSGGQRQRVALARCLVAEARVILFDEPLANLDVHLRASLAEAFSDIHRQSGATVVYVTHDQAEALALADRIAVMDAGRVLQLAAPEEIYRSPASAAVAGFVGRGALLAATVVERRGGGAVVAVGGTLIAARAGDAIVAGPARLLVRPEALRPASEGLPARVVRTTYRGPVHEVEAVVADTGERLVLDCAVAPALGETLRLAVADAWVLAG